MLGSRIAAISRDCVAEVNQFVQKQVHAVKACMEKEGFDCESELWRSYDVMLDEKDAERVTSEICELRKSGLKAMNQIDVVGKKFVEKVE